MIYFQIYNIIGNTSIIPYRLYFFSPTTFLLHEQVQVYFALRRNSFAYKVTAKKNKMQVVICR